MGWKDKSLTFKTSIIFGVLSFITLLSFFIYIWVSTYAANTMPISGPSILPTGGSSCYVYNWISGEPNDILKYGYNGNSWKGECVGVLIFHIFLLIIMTSIAFGIGAIIGFIYSKLKSKKGKKK